MPVALPEKRALLLKLRNPKRVTDVLQRHQIVDEAEGLVAVPHKTEAMLVLKNLGIDIGNDLAPIQHLYKHPKLRGLFGPMPHQSVTAAFTSLHPKCFVLSEQRTGKSASVLWASDFLKLEKTTRGATLIVSTMSCLRRVWRDEIFSLFPSRTVGVLHGDRKTRLALLGNKSYDYLVINHDGIKTIGTQLVDAVLSGAIGHIIVDEGGDFSDHTTEKWKTLKAICDPCQWVWWLTATPTSKGPDKAWAQCQIINPRTVPETYSEWRAQVQFPLTRYKWLPRAEAPQRVHDALQPAIRFFKRDVIKDLPPLTHQHLDADLTKEQVEAVRQLRDQGATLIDGQVVEAVNAAVLIGKVLQVCAGVVKDSDGGVVELDCTPRLNVLQELIEHTDQKVLVFASHRAVIDRLVREVGAYAQLVWVDGRVTGRARDAAIRAFQEDRETKVFIAHPKTVSHGLEFSVADTLVWWSPYHSAETVAQANERMASAAQKNPMGIYYLSGHSVERACYQTVKDGLNLQEAAMKLFGKFLDGVDDE